MGKFFNHNWYDRIDETVLLGALPLRSLADKLINEENVRGVVSMNEDYELYFFCVTSAEWESYNVEFLQLSSKDLCFEAPSQDKLIKGVQFIQKISKSKNSVYAHCKAGRTRSPTLVGCYLMSKNGWSPKEAVNFMRKKRAQITIFEKHWDALEKYYENCIHGSIKENKFYELLLILFS